MYCRATRRSDCCSELRAAPALLGAREGLGGTGQNPANLRFDLLQKVEGFRELAAAKAIGDALSLFGREDGPEAQFARVPHLPALQKARRERILRPPGQQSVTVSNAEIRGSHLVRIAQVAVGAKWFRSLR